MATENNIKTLVLFDLDGTVIDTSRAIKHSLKETLKTYLGKQVEDNKIDYVFGIPAEDTLHHFGVDYKNIQEALDYWNDLREKYKDEMVFFNNIENTLDSLLKKGCKLGVVTSRTKSEIQRELSNKNLERFFEHIVTVEDTKQPKPSSQPLEYACSLFGFKDPDDVIYIGDSIYDYQCAKNFKCRFVLAAWGFDVLPDDDRKKSDYIFYDPTNILDIL